MKIRAFFVISFMQFTFLILNVKIKLEIKEVYMENIATSNKGKSNKIFGVILTESKGTIQKILEKLLKHTQQ